MDRKSMKDVPHWSLQRLRNTAAREMQKAIRMEAADDDGVCICVTCGVRKHFKDMHAGHFVSGRCNAVLFDERGIHPQCVRCNTFLNGKPQEYAKYMLGRYGEELVEELTALQNQSRTFTREELCEMRGRYRARIKTQERRLGV